MMQRNFNNDKKIINVTGVKRYYGKNEANRSKTDRIMLTVKYRNWFIIIFG